MAQKRDYVCQGKCSNTDDKTLYKFISVFAILFRKDERRKVTVQEEGVMM